MVESTINLGKILTKSLKLFEIIDEQNLKIIEALYNIGPRNLMELSRVTGIPKSTLYNRVKKIRETGVSVEPLINASRMGLKRFFIKLHVKPGRLSLVYDIINSTPWRRKVVASYEPYEMIFVKFYAPAGHDYVIKKLLKRLTTLRLIKDYRIYETHEEIFGLGLSSEYVDVNEKAVKLPWHEWYHNIVNSDVWKRNSLPLNILENPQYEIKVDKHDVLILQYLEVDAFRDYVELGRLVGLSPATVKHHYSKHLVGYKVILGYVPRVALFHPDMLNYLYGVIDFPDEKTMLNFVNILWNSPIMPRFARVLGDAKIIATFVIPKTEEVKFLAFMEGLVKENVVYSYTLYPIVVRTLSTWTIPAEMFTEHSWLSGWDVIVKAIRRTLKREKEVYSRKTR